MFGLTQTRKLTGAILHRRPPYVIGRDFVDYLVVAGGGGSGRERAGGGGAGGYRTNLGTSGANSAQEATIFYSALRSTTVTITVGAGGTGVGGSTFGRGGVGVDSTFSTITSAGGGGGGGNATTMTGGAGGSGGGGNDNACPPPTFGAGTALQGKNG